MVPEVLDDFLHRPRGTNAGKSPIVLDEEAIGEIRIGLGSCCVAQGSGEVHEAIGRELARSGAPAVVKRVGCVGMCHQAPLIELVKKNPNTPNVSGDPCGRAKSESIPKTPGKTDAGINRDSDLPIDAFNAGASPAANKTNAGAKRRIDAATNELHKHTYAKVSAQDAAKIVRHHFRPTGFLRRLADRSLGWLDRFMTNEPDDPIATRAIDPGEGPVCEFLGPQKHLATESFGQLDPTDLDEYLQHGGFVAFRKCLAEKSPDEVVEMVQASGLRGRGGGGFSTGQKWAITRAAGKKQDSSQTSNFTLQTSPVFVICNGDEGDPGAFMDRMLLESFPYRIIEGMAIAAYAVGAQQGFFYIRAEYPLAVRRIKDALDECRRRGLLAIKTPHGDRPQFDLTLEVKEGAGAFVCGEETALLESIEGRRGIPRLRPPYPARAGLWGKPTSVNNVETFSMLPWLVRNGVKAFTDFGTESSRGTKVFALAGKIRRGGLIEVPMGTTIRQVVEEIGGGVQNNKTFKAVQIGGPSGGCVPAALADTPIDFQTLGEVGAIMGSGGLVVLDDTDCMVDMARYFLEFTQDQSCGKCTFCRIGTRRMLDILNRICEGQGRQGDIEELESLALAVQRSSLCGLGRTAPSPVLSTIRYFRDEYEAHLEGRCPAGSCKSLITYKIGDRCIGCTRCAQACPANSIPMRPYEQHAIDSETCTRCDVCREVCPRGAIYIE
jgi:NADH-quinone oxidoreductase subunit F